MLIDFCKNGSCHGIVKFENGNLWRKECKNKNLKKYVLDEFCVVNLCEDDIKFIKENNICQKNRPLEGNDEISA